MPAAPTVCRRIAAATSSSSPSSASSAAAHRSVQDLLGPASLHGADGDGVACGRRQRVLVRELAAVVMQQARELGLLHRGAEPLRQEHGFGRHTMRVVTPAAERASRR